MQADSLPSEPPGKPSHRIRAPLCMEFSRQEYWSGLPFPSPRDFPNPGIEHGSPALQADSLLPEPPGKPCLHRFTYSAVPYKLKHTIFILLHLLLSLLRFIRIVCCASVFSLFLVEHHYNVWTQGLFPVSIMHHLFTGHNVFTSLG